MTDTSTDRYRLAPVTAIPPGEGRNFRVGGREIAIFRTRTGDLYATQASCPHRGGPLADGLLGGGRIVCPFHSYAFDLSSGESVGGICPALRTYRVWADEEGWIWTVVVEEHAGAAA